MVTTFIILATIIIAFFMFAWSSNGFLNMVIKTLLLSMVVFGIVVILSQVVPSLQLANGVRLW